MREILSKTDNPDPQKLARTAIHLLEQEIHKMGYDIEMGAELEFVVKTKDELKNEENPLGLPKKLHFQGVYTPQSKLSTNNLKDPLFAGSPYIAFSHKELPSLTPYFQYETVITHEAGRMIRDNKSKALYTARAIEKTYADIFQRLGNNNKVEKIFIEPYLPVPNRNSRIFIINGLHINMSLHDIAGAGGDRLYDNLLVSLKNCNCELLYLLGTDKNSIKRYKEKDEDCETIQNKCKEKYGSYIENSIPSASSNPYYAVLVTLLGVYQGLKMAESGVETTENKDTLFESATKAKQTFEAEDNPYRKILNDIDPEPDEPKLGERFWDAIAKTPPSTEPRLYQKTGKVNLAAQTGGI